MRYANHWMIRVIFIGCAMLGVALADGKKDGLIERSNAMPDPNQVSAMQNIAFQDAGVLSLSPARMGSRRTGNYADRPFRSGEFAWTRSFLGIKNPWLGTRVFSMREAAAPMRSGLSKTTRAYPVRDLADARASRDAGKKAATGQDLVTPRAFPVRGTAQGAINAEHGNVSKKMTVEEVRELLNRNR